MGSLLRSERMTLIQIIEQNGAARDVVSTLGEIGVVQFRDLNAGLASYKRSFADEVKRCDDMSRRLGFILDQVLAAGLTPLQRDEEASLAPMADLDSNLRQTHEELRAMKANEVDVLRSHNALKEHMHVLEMGSGLFSRTRESVPSPSSSLEEGMHLGPISALVPKAQQGEAMLTCLTGTLPRARAPAFLRAVHRVTRGNCMVRDAPIDEPLLDGDRKSPEAIAKNFFMVFSSGTVLRGKLAKLCVHFGATLYDYPDDAGTREQVAVRLRLQLAEIAEVLQTTVQHRRHMLEWVAQQWSYWRYICSREKATLHTLNLLNFDIRRKVFVAEGWVPTAKVAAVRSALRRATIRTGGETDPILNVLETSEVPPTSIPTTKYSAGFQALVNTYGIPRYREINPGVFAIICFPFLFAIMFGDVGHGSLLVGLAAYFIYNEESLGKQKLDDMVSMAFGGRYVLLLNGLFAIYVGFIYNEAFAVPLGLFHSTYEVQLNPADNSTSAVWDGTVYPFGIDPMWHLASNKMTFFNSFKMKVSIVFGVIQMSLGIFLSLLNHIEFRDPRSIWFQFVPEATFFVSIFGYLVFMIFAKWATDWVAISQQPPSLLNTLISMFMAPGVYTEEARLFEGQEHLQLFLVGIAFLAVPPLLLGKPLLALFEHRRRTRRTAYHTMTVAPPADEEAEGEEEEEEEEFEFGEIMVHQVIHTIEFVLGSISNTASYLRLWALSLAHSQLSELFWEKVMREQGFPAATLPFPFNGIVIFLAFAVWLILNLGVLMVMENLSSFLHALRLQWVEFQNKFYHGDGQKFVPFTYDKLDEDIDAD